MQKEKKTTKGSASQIQGKPDQVKKHEILRSLGGSGTSIIDGYIREEYNADLSGLSGMEKFDQMRKSDAMVFATLLACELPIRSTKRFIDPYRDEDNEASDESKEIADFVKRNLFKQMEVTWDTLLGEILTMLPFGFSIFEKVYTVKDGQVILKKLASRKQTTIKRWKTIEGKAGVTQLIPNSILEEFTGQEVSIPAWKLAVFTFRQEGDNYEGVSILRSSYKHWYIKDQLYRFDAVKHERQSVGIPVLYPAEGATDEDLELLAEIGENLRANEQASVVMPGPKSQGWEIEMLDMKASQTSNIFESINHHNREISKNILAQFLELGNTESGSRALSEDQSDLFILGLSSIANHICDVFNRYIIPELVDLNFDTDSYPHLKFNKLGSVDYEKLANSLATLANSRIIEPDDDLETHVRDTLDLPSKMERQDGEDGGQRRPVKPKPTDPQGDGGEEIDPKEVKKEESVKASECCGHDHHGTYFDDEYWKTSQLFNNRSIIRLQNEVRKEDLDFIKKKGLSFNDFEKVAPRALTFAERKVNFTSLNRAMDTFEGILEERLQKIGAEMKQDLLKQVKKAVEDNDIAAVGTISAKHTGKLAQALTEVQKEMFEIGKRGAAVEMGVKTPPTKKEVKGALRVQNETLVQTFKNDMDNKTRSAVIQVVNNNAGSVTNTNSAAAMSAASEVFDLALGRIQNNLKTLGITGAVNLGRATIFERYPERVYGYQYSAILDSRTTDYCRSLDGRVVKPGSAEFYNYKPPKHYNCRSIWVEILVEETFKPKFTGIPSSIKAPQTIETFQKMKAPIVLKNSPAIVQIKSELQERKEKLAELEKTGKFPNRQKQHKERIKNLEKSLSKVFSEAMVDYTKEILEADGIRFK